MNVRDKRIFARSIDVHNDIFLSDLEERLALFYAGNVSYYDLAADSGKDLFFSPIVDLVVPIVKDKGKIRILEVGAGKSRLPAFLRRHLKDAEFEYVAHDINSTNREYYEKLNVSFIAGDLGHLSGQEKYDIIVSLFSFEHMSRPTHMLDLARSMLVSGGHLIVVSPKYVVPFYVPPALRYLPRWRQIFASFSLSCRAILVFVLRRPNFYVALDPAVFHGPWRRDYDAVHLVSSFDLPAYFGRAWRISRLKVRFPTLKSALLGRLMLLTTVISSKADTKAVR